MLQWMAGASTRLRFVVVPLALALIGFGVVQLRDAPTDVLPEYEAPRIVVQTEALGLAADEVEQLITAPLEADLLNGVAWLDTISSQSVTGLSSIELVFERGTDIYEARQLVQERLTQAQALPHVSKPPTMIQPLSATSRVVMIGLSSDEVSLIDMSVLTRFTLRPRLMGIPGVANVTVFGQRERQLRVHVDPATLARQRVSLNQVISTTGNALWVSPLTFLEASTPGTGGFIDTPNQRLGIQHLLPIATPEELSRVAVEDTGPRALRLGDVATVVEEHQPLIGDAVVNDEPSLMLVVEKFPGADPRKVTRDVEALLDAMRPGLGGIETDTTVFRPASFIEDARRNVAVTSGIGLLAGLLLLVGLFLAWRTAVVCLVALPAALLAALLVLQWRGTSVSALVLVGLAAALTVLVDDVVVASDALSRRRTAEHLSDPAMPFARLSSTRSPLLFATAVVLLAVLPVALLSGATGAFFRPLVVTYALAVLASLVVASTVTPAVASLLPGSHRASRPGAVARRLRRGYDRSLVAALAHPRRVVVGSLLALVAGLVALPPLGGQPALPAMQDRNLLVSWEAAPGTSRTEMNRITARASQELRSLPGVRNVGAHVGRAVTGDQVSGINLGQMWVTLHSSADYTSTREAVQAVLAGYPGLAHEVQTYPEARVRQISGGEEHDVVVRVYGQEPAVLRAEADGVRRLVAGVDGVGEVAVDLPTQEPTLEVQVDLATAQRYGVKPGDVRRAAATLLSGVEVGNLFEQQKVFDVVVVGSGSVRHSPDSVADLLIETPRGQVRLGDVAQVRVAANRTVIRRESVSPYLDVTATVTGRDREQVVRDLESQLRERDFPVEYHAQVLGASDAGATRGAPLYVYVLAAALSAYLVLQAATGSWRLAAALFVALPLGLTGAVVAAELDGGVEALSSFAGLLAVLGLAARWVVLLVRELQEQHAGPSDREQLARCCGERMLPCAMTALLLAAVLVPFAVLGDGPGREALQPIAVMVLGGLVTTLGLALYAVPALYLRFGAAQPPTALAGDVPRPRIDLTAPTPTQEAFR